MPTFILRAMQAVKKYSVIDFAGLKIALVVAGILLGAYGAQFFLKHTLFLWVVFLASYLWIMYRTFIKHMN